MANSYGLKFELGELVITQGIRYLIEQQKDEEDSGRALKNIAICLVRHNRGDWGDLCAQDKNENNYSLDKHLRLLSAYETKFGKIWIITEADRSATTILLPEEY